MTQTIPDRVVDALTALERNRAVRRAHATIRKQLRVAAEDGGPAEVGTVSVAEDNTIEMDGIIFDILPGLKRALKANKSETLHIRIHSPGGSAFEGSAIYNVLRGDGREITTTAMGMAASAASLVFMAGDHRIVAPGATLMIHDVWSCGIGNAAELRAMADTLDVASDAIAELYVDRAGGTVAEWRDRMATDTWLTGDDAVELGLATGRAKPVAKKPKARAKQKAMPKPEDDDKAGEGDGGDPARNAAPHNTSEFWGYAGI